jgi:two-component system, OmpR family, sensor histidine kinase QseC
VTPEISVRKRLLAGVMIAISLIWLAVIGLVFNSSSNEIGEVYDAALASYARVLATLMAHEAIEEREVQQKLEQLVSELGEQTAQKIPVLRDLMEKFQSPSESADYLRLDLTATIQGHHYESKIVYLVKAADGRVLLRSSTQAPFEEATEGYQTVTSGGDRWRIFRLTVPEEAVAVMVAENVDIRSELLRKIVVNGLWPFLIVMPVIALVILGVINKGLQPLQLITQKVSQRSPLSLEPLSNASVPVEILPLVNELNHLFQRIEQTLENERRFTANAAHELRTPLAALKTHTQVLQLNATAGMRPAITQILHGIDRATHMVEQLLTLARAEAKANEGIEFKRLELASLVRGVLMDIAGLALDKEIKLSFDNRTGSAWVKGDEALLQIVIRNLVDNAIRYTPAKGSVKVSLDETAGEIRLGVEDTGPGIDPDKQGLMLQRFQRNDNADQQGVGLGLCIVNQIVGLHHNSLELKNASARGGLVVRLAFKKA